MNNTCSKRFTHYYPSRSLSFFIYNLSQSPLWSIQSQYVWIICAQGTIIHNTSSPIARSPIYHLARGEMHGKRNKSVIKSVPRKFR